MISILVPSRGRPELFERMRASANDNGVGRHEILLRLDADDPENEEYDRRFVNMTRIGRPESVGRCWNQLAARARGDWLMMGNDDLVFQTQNWDCALLERLEEAWEDHIFVAWCNDGSPNAAERCAFPIVHRKWYNALGYFTPTCFNFLWNDTWIADIGRRLGRLLYIPDVLVEHKHFTFKKADYDDTYRRHREGSSQVLKRKEDREMFQCTVEDRERAVVKLTVEMDR